LRRHLATASDNRGSARKSLLRPPLKQPWNVSLPKKQSRALRFAIKFSWLVLGGDPAARSRGVEQFTAL
jgi:hypothetical protein